MNILLKTLALLLFSLFITVANAGNENGNNLKPRMDTYVPENGYVPDEITAVLVAEAILVPIYGKAEIERQKPFVTSLSGNVWTITGSIPKNLLGGVFLIQINKQDGTVIRLTHGK